MTNPPTKIEGRMLRLFALLIATWLVWLACSDGRSTDPTTGWREPWQDPPKCEADSLREVIGHLQFIIGQQWKMIDCLQRGDTNCYGGV